MQIISDITESKFSVPITTKTEDSREREDITATESDSELPPFYDPHCTDCHAHHVPNDKVMCLHALSYKSRDWEFSTEPPQWAREYLDLDQEVKNEQNK